MGPTPQALWPEYVAEIAALTARGERDREPWGSGPGV